MTGRSARRDDRPAAATRLVLVVTGTSGAGKGTLERLLLARMPELELAVSATTRERRPGEEDGREYWFISEEKFARLVEEDEFLEHVELPWGARSGTLRSEIDRIRAHGRIPLLDLETDGALRVQERISGAVTVFVDAPTYEELERRLRERATESPGEIQVRLELARKQQQQKELFDYLVVNDDVERAADELAEIVRRELRAAGTINAHDPSPHR
jgi:guanylate kinase